MIRVLKKSMSVLLIIFMLLSMLPAGVFNNSVYAYQSGDFIYSVTDSCVTITDYVGAGGDVVIPDTLSGFPVTVIGEYSFDAASITSITIPASVTSIEAYAFRSNSISSLTLPSILTSIGDLAFAYNQITSLTIPGSVITIGAGAFSTNTQLSEIILEYGVESIGLSAFYNCTGLTSVTMPNSVTTIGNNAFKLCTGLESITIPGSITSMGYSVFESCTSLASVTLSNNLTGIGVAMFSGCSNLTSITIPESVTSIGNDAFSGCEKLATITIPGTLDKINNNTFYGCSALTNITFPNSLISSIGDYAFYECGNLTNIVLPSSVTSIGEYAFYGCSTFTEFIIPELVTSIGDRAFQSCTGLTDITISESVTSIGEGAFAGCDVLTNVNLPSGMTVIDQFLFASCGNLESIIIPDGVTSIGSHAFDGCTSLAIVHMPENLLTISSYVFEDCTSLERIAIPENVTNIGFRAFYNCNNLVGAYYYGDKPTIESEAFKYLASDYEGYYLESNSGFDPSSYSLFKTISSITVTSDSDNVIRTQTLQMTAVILPEESNDQPITWSIIAGTGSATVDTDGLLTATGTGTVTVRATANDGSWIYDEITIDVLESTQVSSITVVSDNNRLIKGEDLQMSAQILPIDATAQTVTWSVINGTGSATIDHNGLLSATGVGTVTVRATANDESSVYGEKEITITLYDGLGTEESPYLVYTKEDLNNVRNDLSAYYKLMNDIQFVDADFESGGTYYNDGAGFVPIGTYATPFTGTFDGNGYTIENLYVYATATEDSKIYAGLFGASSGTIQNLGMEGGSITAYTATDYIDAYAGGIVARQLNGTITGSHNSNDVMAEAFVNEYAGGIAGYQDAGLVTQSFNTGKIEVGLKVNPDGSYYEALLISMQDNVYYDWAYGATGGIIGYSKGNITECYNNGLITTPYNGEAKSDCFGGITAVNDSGMISDCYNVGSIMFNFTMGEMGKIYAGGICSLNNGIVTNSYQAGVLDFGENLALTYSPVGVAIGENNGNVENTYYKANGILTGIQSGTTTGATALSHSEMCNETSYIGFDFENVWTMDGNEDYPLPEISSSTLGSFEITDITILTENGFDIQRTQTKQFYADTFGDPLLIWEVIDGTGSATIDQNGLLTAVNNGTVTVRVTRDNISGIFDEETITIFPLSVETINVTSSSDKVGLGYTMQMNAEVIPSDADDPSYSWSVQNGTGSAIIDQSGLLTATGVGTVIVYAHSNDGHGAYGEKEITIGEPIKVSSITVNSNSATVLRTETLQMSVDILPTDADDQSVTWSVVNGTGSATIDQNGLLTATGVGTVTVRATANDGSDVYGEKEITVEPIKVSSITVNSNSDKVQETKTMQMSVDILPADADDQSVTWSVVNGTGSATIDQNGLLSAIGEGSVTVRATANDGSDVYGEKEITVEPIKVSSIAVNSNSDKVQETNTMQMSVDILPADADDQSVTWSVINGTGSATIDQNGLLSAIGEGSVTVRATANDGSDVYGAKEITITSYDPTIFIIYNGRLTGYYGPGGSVNIPEGVTEISSNVFKGRKDITNVTFPSTLEVIGDHAFTECNALTNFILPEGLLSIEESAFASCVSLTDITIPDSVTSIGDSIFFNCMGLQYVYLSENITRIGTYSFLYCIDLKQINIPEGVTYIGRSAFKWCESLESITLPSTLQIMYNEAFSGCYALKEIIVPEGVGRINSSVFSGCSSLEKIILPSSLNYIDPNAFSGTAISGIVIPEGVSEIEIGAFGGCSNLEYIRIPSSVHTILSFDEFSDAMIFCDEYSYAYNQAVNYGYRYCTSNVTSIELLSAPDKLSYKQGEDLDLQNGMIRIYCEDASTIDFDIGAFMISGYDPQQIGAQTINVNFEGQTTTFEVSVKEVIKVSSITVNSASDTVSEVLTLQMSTEILPIDADDKSVTWSVINVTGSATINQDGLLIPSDIGTVTVRATANDGSGVYGQKTISVITVAAPQVSIMGYTGKIKLTWDAVEGASAYRICVYDESTGDYVRVDATKETSYIVYGLTDGQEYTYIVRAYTGISWSADEVAVSATPLARPEVSIVGGDEQATLSWQAVTGASKYEIFSYDDGTYEYLAETTELSYTFSSLTNGVRYDYSVRAVSDTSYSTRSSKLLASVIPVSAPQVSIMGYTGKIKLTWDAVEGASAYRICVYDESTGDYVRVDATKETSYIVYGLTNGQEYTYIVRAYTGISWSADEVAVSTTPLARPEVSIVGGDSQATLSWQAVTGASKYEIFSYDDGTYEYLAETTELSYTFSSLTNGVRYDYSVRAVSDTSYSTRSSKLLASVIPVSAPQVSIMGYTGKIKLTWDAVEGASAYRICVYDESTGDYVRVDGTKETSYIVYGLTNGQEYTYIVRAYTGISWSADEVAVSTTPLARPEVSIVGGDSQATLSWDAVPGASKYEIFSYDDGTYEYLAETTELSYTFSSLTNGVRYDYSVRAVSDTSYSTRSSKLLASVIPVSAPQVSIIGYTGKIKLTWDAVEGASAYRICVYDESTGDYVRVDGTKETSYVVYGLTDGQEYTYIVRAYTGISWSADEVAVSATPLARPEVSIIGGDEQATLSWQAVTGASKYEIFSYDDGTYEYLAETTELSYTFSSLTNGVRYDYSVRAVSDTSYSTRSSKLLASVIPSAE